MARLMRTFLATTILAGAVVLGYWRLTLDQQAKAIQELQALNAEMERTLASRQQMIDRLSRSRRIAHLQVTHQQRADDGTVDRTTLRFIELDDQGGELARQEFTVPGDVVFVDAWTVKFDPERVAEGHPLMRHTLVLLRRIYSDRMPPRDGLAIDTPGAIPPGYATTEPSRFEQRVWENFWTLAGDAEQARRFGVRVAQGEAAYKPMREGQTYELVVDAAGGMSLLPLAATKDESLTKVEPPAAR